LAYARQLENAFVMSAVKYDAGSVAILSVVTILLHESWRPHNPLQRPDAAKTA
jgi:hypothetical protein